jgi:hypothetical protein
MPNNLVASLGVAAALNEHENDGSNQSDAGYH